MRITRHVPVSLAAACAAALLVGCATASDAVAPSGAATPSGPPKLTVAPLDRSGSAGDFQELGSEASTRSLPRTLPVYRVVPADVGRAWVVERAAGLGLGSSVAEDARSYMARGRAAVLEVDKATGSFDYTTDALTEQAAPIRRLLSDAEYRARAEAFLLEHGLMHDDAVFRDINRGNVVGTLEGGRWVERPYLVEARFSHAPLDGVDFDEGVGPKIVVQFGEGGVVLGAMSVWREVKRADDYELKTPAQAIEDVKAGRARVTNAGKGSVGTVETIELSYLNEPLGYVQEYVLPAYVMRGRLSDGRQFTATVRAVPDQSLKLDESLATGAVQAPASQGRD